VAPFCQYASNFQKCEILAEGKSMVFELFLETLPQFFVDFCCLLQDRESRPLRSHRGAVELPASTDRFPRDRFSSELEGSKAGWHDFYRRKNGYFQLNSTGEVLEAATNL